MPRKVFVQIIILFTIFTATTVPAAELGSTLQETLRQAGPNDWIDGLILLDDQVDATALAAQHNHLGRAEVHRRVVTALQAKANQTQGAVMSSFDAPELRADILTYEPLWIVNGFLITAKPAVYAQLAHHPDVARIERQVVPRLDQPVSSSPATRETENSEQGLHMIGAPQMWEMGYTGTGVLVSNSDSGVEISHPALVDRWRGNLGYSGDISYYPWPQPAMDNDHGTHVMGTQCGREPATADTIGVAPDAEWIAAHVLSGGGSSYLAYQWLADPDDDPNTIADVPVVNNNSWGWNDDTCDDRGMTTVIENLEAAQVAVIFSAGNSGPDPSTITSPKTVAITPTHVFCVGSVNQGGYIAGSSSRGPTICNNEYHIKPEVVARGVNVRSAIFGGEYGQKSGTSMAAPHVSGAMALLAQAHPDRTIQDLKTALYLSGLDQDSTPGEDNTYGNGLVWIPAAHQILNDGFGYLIATVFDSETMHTVPLHPVEILPYGLHPYTMPAGMTQAYPVPVGEAIVTAQESFGVRPDTMSVTIEDGQTLNAFVYLTPLENGTFTGNFVDDNDAPVTAYMNFVHQDNPDHIVIGETDVNGYYTVELMAGTYDLHIQPEPPYMPQTLPDLTVGEQQVVELETQIFYPADFLLVDDDGGAPYDTFYTDALEELDISYFVLNREDATELEDALMLFDHTLWFTGDEQTATLTSEDRDALITYLEAGRNLIVSGQYIGDDIGTSPFFGDYLKAIHTSDHVATDIITGVADDAIGDGMFFAIIGGAGAANQVSQSGVAAQEGAHVFVQYQNSEDGAAVRYHDPDFDFKTVYCGFGIEAIVAPPQFTDRAEFIAAILNWQAGTTAIEDAETPAAVGLALHQNYPNPFNPSTTISFSIPTRQALSLRIYNTAGQLISTVHDGQTEPGAHEMVWNGTNDRGEAVTSGVYLYRLQTETQTLTRRMVLLK